MALENLSDAELSLLLDQPPEEDEQRKGIWSTLRQFGSNLIDDPSKIGPLIARLPADLALAPIELVRSAIKDPTGVGLPELGEMLGAVTGATVTGPAGFVGAPTGALVGRAAGEALGALLSGESMTERFSDQAVVENLLGAPVFALPWGLLAGTAKTKFKGGLTPKEASNTIIQQAVIPPDPELDNTIRMGMREAFERAKRQQFDIPMAKIEQADAMMALAPDLARSKDMVARRAMLVQQTQAWKEGLDATIAAAKAQPEIQRYVYGMINDRRLAELDPFNIYKPEGGKHPLVSALTKAGIDLTPVQFALRQSDHPAAKAFADIVLRQESTSSHMTETLLRRLDTYLEKYAVKAADAPMFYAVSNHAPLMRLIADTDEISPDFFKRAQVALKESIEGDAGLAELLRYAADDSDFLRVAQFVKDVKTNIDDPIYAAAFQLQPDKIAPYRKEFFASTMFNPRAASQLDDDIARLMAMRDETTNEFMKTTLDEQIKANRRKLAATKDYVERSRAKFGEWIDQWQRFGILPKARRFGSLEKTKTADLPFDPDINRALTDYITAGVRKITLDESLPLMKKMVDLTGDNRHLQQYMGKVMMDQAGWRSASKLKTMTDWLSWVPGVTEERVGNIIHNVNTWYYNTHIALNPRFAPINLTQNLTLLRPMVGDDTFAEALAKVYTDYDTYFQQARDYGLIPHDHKQLFETFGQTATGKPLYRHYIADVGEKLRMPFDRAAVGSEQFNRVLAFAAGMLDAERAGKLGQDALDHAARIVAMTNFDYTVAGRPIISNTPMGSLVWKFKSYSSHYAAAMAHLYQTDKAKFTDALVSTVALAGTAGIPLYDGIRQAAAEMGFFLPELDPVAQVTGLEVGQSMDPFMRLPRNMEEAFGVVLGPATTAAFAAGQLATGHPEAAADLTDALRRGTGIIGRTLTAGSELLRGGRTTTPAGTIKAERSPEDILLSLAGFKPSVASTQYKTTKDLALAERAQDFKAQAEILNEAFERGLRSLGRLQGEAKRRNRSAATEAIRNLFGQ